MRTLIPVALAAAIAISAAALWTKTAPATPKACTDRVFLTGENSFSWGSVTRWRGGHLTAFHVIDGATVRSGPPVASIGALPATDFAFLTGSDPQADPDSVPFPAGRVTLEGYPARATVRERLTGDIYAPDTVPPGVWVILDHSEPLVGGFSGGCVRDSQGRVVAVIMGASTMQLDGKPRHFARVIPIRAALAEIQGTPPTAPLAFTGKPLPPAPRWPDTRSAP
jgi:hypothetical protein